MEPSVATSWNISAVLSPTVTLLEQNLKLLGNIMGEMNREGLIETKNRLWFPKHD